VKRCFQLTAALLVCLSLGLHWAALQSVAWTTMVIERSCATSLSDALATTFDGQHPCKLCRVVQAGQAVEDSAPGLSPHGLKLEGFASAQAVRLSEPPGGMPHGGVVWRPAIIASPAPPLPPPRAA